MNFFDRLRTQKVLSFTLILFTLSVGIVIGTLVNQGVKAAKSETSMQKFKSRQQWLSQPMGGI